MVTDRQDGVHTHDSMLARIRRAWARDSHLSLARRAQKGVQLVVQLTRARILLKPCSTVGRNARVAGSMRIENAGSIRIGDHLNVNSSWVPTEFLTGPGGEIEIGDDVLINFGTVIAAGRSVVIGSGSMIGPHCIISDVDIPESVSGEASVAARPIEIGRDVWLAGRVTVRPGVRIGDGAVVVAGSIVETDVPPQVMASGIPARLLPKLGAASRPGAAHGATFGTVTQAVRPSAAPAPATRRGVVISDFRLDELVQEMRAGSAGAIEALALPFAEYAHGFPVISSDSGADFAILWTTIVGAIPAVAHLYAGDQASDEQLDSQIASYCDLVRRLASRYAHVFVILWTPGPPAAGFALDALRVGGVARAVACANAGLIGRVQNIANVFALDPAPWRVGDLGGAATARAWYLARMAFPQPVLARAASDLNSSLSLLAGRRRRLLVVSVNDTLWLRSAGGPMASPESREAYADFQRLLRRLVRRGLQLAVVGEGEEANLRAALERRLQPVLLSGDITAWQVGADDMVTQVAAVADRLHVALHEVTVIDTRPTVRERVREALPDVDVPDWPEDVLLYPAALQEIGSLAATHGVPAGVPGR